MITKIMSCHLTGKVRNKSETDLLKLYSLYIICSLIIGLNLFLDIFIPLGVAMGVPYITAVWISLWMPSDKNTIIVAVICSVFTICAFFFKPSVPEMWKVIINRMIALLAIWETAILGIQRKISDRKREHALQEREIALRDVRVLRGLLRICASCKRLRDDAGGWTEIESYIKTHSEAEFTHGICPDCALKIYPEIYGRK